MFEGRTYIHEGGYKATAIRFDGVTKHKGVATTSYSFGMSDEERWEMARRITAALNLTTNLTVEQIEAAVELKRQRDAKSSNNRVLITP